MNIVINIKSLSTHSFYDQNIFVTDCFVSIVNDHPEHSFIFIADKNSHKFLTSENSTVVATTPISGNTLLWKIWYTYKLPILLKKYKADVFINMDSICSIKTKVPQCLLVSDISFPKKTFFYKKTTPFFFDKATMIITFSQLVKNEICRQYYKIKAEKIEVVHTGANGLFLPADWKEKENTKEKYSEAKEYFLYSGEINAETNLVNILKAFSFFKKRQKSNMQFIIATTAFLTTDPFFKILKTYKYRNDVKLLADLQEIELAKITAAAYAFIYTTQQNGFYVPVLQAMQCGVPVIAANSAIITEICGDAALFTDPTVFENVADKMMLLFKDEDKRNELIIKGKNQAAKYSLMATNQQLWQNIVKCAAANG